MNKEELIKSRIQVVCICKGIRQGRICDAIKQGCDSVEKVTQKTGSCKGGCRGRRCTPVIEKLIKSGGEPLKRPHNPDGESDTENEMAGQEGFEPPTS